IADRLLRGKVDFTLWTERTGGQAACSLNADAVKGYVQQMQAISQSTGLPMPSDHLWEVLVRLPEVTQSAEAEELTDEEWEAARTAIAQALTHLTEFRAQEGAALSIKFTACIESIRSLLGQIEPYEQGRVARIRQRLEDRLSELKGVDYDKNRLEQELIYYIEKLDISEEKQRLANHLDYFMATMQKGEGQGKKLGFIAQEMGREINTTGSKSNQAEMQNIVVRMKDELEQIKEQVLNVL
ncbi:MAG: YicC family protein, partial [Bacteroidales bacterium]|nr:YicC family protein [Bacteroidales bacterium]